LGSGLHKKTRYTVEFHYFFAGTLFLCFIFFNIIYYYTCQNFEKISCKRNWIDIKRTIKTIILIPSNTRNSVIFFFRFLGKYNRYWNAMKLKYIMLFFLIKLLITQINTLWVVLFLFHCTILKLFLSVVQLVEWIGQRLCISKMFSTGIDFWFINKIYVKCIWYTVHVLIDVT